MIIVLPLSHLILTWLQLFPLLMHFIVSDSGCVKEEPDHQQSQDHLIDPIASTENHFLSFCSCSYDPVNGH